MSLDALAELYRQFPEVSLRRFAAALKVAYWRLRDFIMREKDRQARERKERELKAQVKEMALRHPTYGHKFIHQELIEVGIKIGRHKVRRIMKELGLAIEKVKKPRREVAKVTPEAQYPLGRRVQIDATQVKLDAGKAWVYIVQDVTSRACLAIKPVWSLSQHCAREVLAEALGRLRQLGISQAIVIQSDGGSDFTSELFQDYCDDIGCWIRSKVNQKGGMGILERLNRTFKYDFLFREECSSFDQLRDSCCRFEHWYNSERKHSSIGFRTPWQALLEPNQSPTARTASALSINLEDHDSRLIHHFTADNAADSIRDISCCTALILPSIFEGSFLPENDPRKTGLRNCSPTRGSIDLEMRFTPEQKVW